MAHLWEPLPALWKPLAVHAGAEAMRAVTCAALRALGFRASRCQVRGGRAALAASVWAEGAAARALTCCRSCRGCWPRGVACAVHSGQVAASAHTADEFLFKFSLGAAHVKVRWQTAIQLPVCIVMCQNALGWVLGWWYCHNTDVASGVEAAVRLTCARKLLSASRGGGVSALLIAYVLTALLLVWGTGIGSGCQRGGPPGRAPKHARTPAGVHMRALAGCAAAANAASAAGDVPLLFLHGVGLGLARSARAALRVPCAAGSHRQRASGRAKQAVWSICRTADGQDHLRGPPPSLHVSSGESARAPMRRAPCRVREGTMHTKALRTHALQMP